MNVAILAAALIRVFEGVRLTAYQDTGGVWTIGFGHTGPDVKQGDTIFMDEAAALFETDAAPLFKLVANSPGVPLVAAAAYVSFGYNCGAHTLDLVLAGKATLTNFVHDRHGNVLPGLVARRNLEAALIASVAPVSA
jgi:lysozyme